MDIPIEVTGNLVTSALMALVAVFLTQALKQMPPLRPYEPYIPIPLALVVITIGIVLAWLTGNDLVQGGIEGFIAAAMAVFGYEAVKSLGRGRVS